MGNHWHANRPIQHTHTHRLATGDCLAHGGGKQEPKGAGGSGGGLFGAPFCQIVSSRCSVWVVVVVFVTKQDSSGRPN